MRINSVEFHNLKTGWHLVSSKLDVFNLLVGISGVGKTKIVQALCDLAIIATGATDTAYHLEWTLDFSHNDHDYLWKGRIEPSQIAQIRGARENEFTFEQIIVDRDTVLVERKNDTFNFKQSTLPKLKKSESAMVLLAEESSLADLQKAFSRVLISETTRIKANAIPQESLEELIKIWHGIKDKSLSIKDCTEKFVRGGISELSVFAPLASFLTQTIFPESFDEIKNIFISIFPVVTDLRVHRAISSDATNSNLEFQIREESCAEWIAQAEISSGMLKTLVHLLEIALSPAGSVIIIDEFENGLGLNCMPELTRYLSSRDDCQFILTSHHPYVINNLGIDTWKLVQRRGCTVSLTDATSLPELQASSHHEAFIRLVNSLPFRKGLQ